MYIYQQKSQCEVWLCLSEQIRPKSGCILVKCNLRSGSRSMRALNFVLITLVTKNAYKFFLQFVLRTTSTFVTYHWWYAYHSLKNWALNKQRSSL